MTLQLWFEKSKRLVFQGPSDLLVTQYLQKHLGINFGLDCTFWEGITEAADLSLEVSRCIR